MTTVERELDEVKVAYLEAREAGQAPALEEVVARHPQYRDELIDFVTTLIELERAVEHVPEPPQASASTRRAREEAVRRVSGVHQAQATAASEADVCLFINGDAVRTARQKRKLKIDDVAEALVGLGHPTVSVAWVYDLERAPARQIPSSLAFALAKVLEVAVTELMATQSSSTSDRLFRMLDAIRWRAKIESYGQSHRLSLADAKASLARKLSNAVYRESGEPDDAELGRLLDALLESDEP